MHMYSTFNGNGLFLLVVLEGSEFTCSRVTGIIVTVQFLPGVVRRHYILIRSSNIFS